MILVTLVIIVIKQVKVPNDMGNLVLLLALWLIVVIYVGARVNCFMQSSRKAVRKRFARPAWGRVTVALQRVRLWSSPSGAGGGAPHWFSV